MAHILSSRRLNAQGIRTKKSAVFLWIKRYCFHLSVQNVSNELFLFVESLVSGMQVDNSPAPRNGRRARNRCNGIGPPVEPMFVAKGVEVPNGNWRRREQVDEKCGPVDTESERITLDTYDEGARKPGLLTPSKCSGELQNRYRGGSQSLDHFPLRRDHGRRDGGGHRRHTVWVPSFQRVCEGPRWIGDVLRIPRCQRVRVGVSPSCNLLP